ncbi:MAG TPA: ABC transporter substrate-binding protein [Xanthobacteraceae bacterium]|nr:ABC transporter substrate-binding protein [Xanthobacteraceae bacterium]
MRRREFLGVLGGAAAWPLAAQAQEAGRNYRLGFLIPTGRETPAVAAFFDELRLSGFIEGQNLTVVPGGFGVRNDQIVEAAATMVKAAPDAIVGGPELQLRALQAVTRTIPLIGMTEDMVAEGFAASLARPGGNVTGISLLSPELDGKRQEILIEAVPGVRRMAAIADANVTPARHLEALQDAARVRSVELLAFGVATPEKIVPAIDEARAAGAQALNFLASSLFFVHRRIAFEQAAVVHLPAIYQWPEMAEEGGLVGYGSRFTEMYRQRARMVVKILRGAKPADIPVEQPTRFEMVINLNSARVIGHEIPAGLVLRADKVVE